MYKAFETSSASLECIYFGELHSETRIQIWQLTAFYSKRNKRGTTKWVWYEKVTKVVKKVALADQEIKRGSEWQQPKCLKVTSAIATHVGTSNARFLKQKVTRF